LESCSKFEDLYHQVGVLMSECCVVMIQVSIVVWPVACATGVVICHWGVT
jgi:hypothetical protein